MPVVPNSKSVGVAANLKMIGADETKPHILPLKRMNRNQNLKRMAILNLLFHPLLCDLPHEELWIALTNRSSQVIEKVKISQGGTNETSADLRIILKASINALSAGIIVCHNHPSGNTRPSRQDDQLTQRLRDAARLIEIKLLDHIVLADGNYYSYSDDGKL